MTVLRLLTSDQHLVAAHKVKIAAGDINSLILHVEFDDAWDEFIVRKALFENDSVNGDTQDILLVGNECIVPHEVLSAAGVLSISVTGYTTDGVTKKTSTIVKMKVHESLTDATTTIEPTMDLYMQYLAAMNSKVDPVLSEIRTNLLAELNERLEPVTLWENPDSTVNFEPQTIALDLGTYKRFHLLFRVKADVSCQEYIEAVCTEKGLMYKASIPNYQESTSSASDNECVYRDFTILDGGVEFSYARYAGITGKKNELLIPCKIIGYQY